MWQIKLKKHQEEQRKMEGKGERQIKREIQEKVERQIQTETPRTPFHQLSGK